MKHLDGKHLVLVICHSLLMKSVKLSKRDGQILQFIEQYRDLGYLPEALFNFITLLGWSPEGEEEIFSKEEFIKILMKNACLSLQLCSIDKNLLGLTISI